MNGCRVKQFALRLLLIGSCSLVLAAEAAADDQTGGALAIHEQFSAWTCDTLGQIETDLGRSDGNYHDKRKNGAVTATPACIWSLTHQFNALHWASSAGLGGGYQSRAVALLAAIDTADHLTDWNDLTAYVACDGGGNRFYDDNAWLGLALLDLYESTDDVAYLARAEQLAAFCLSGEDTQCGGSGIYFKEQTRRSKQMLSTGGTISLLLRLCAITGTDQYAADAERLYDWVEREMKLDEADGGLFYGKAFCGADVNEDHVVDPLDIGFIKARFGCDVDADEQCSNADANQDGKVNPLDLGYVLARTQLCECIKRPTGHAQASNLMIRVNLLFYDIHQTPNYLEEAQRIGRSLIGKEVFRYGTIYDWAQQGNHFVRAMIMLYDRDGDPRWLNVAQSAALYVYHHRRDPQGHYPLCWHPGCDSDDQDPSVVLGSYAQMQQSAVASAFAQLVPYPTYELLPTDDAFVRQNDPNTNFGSATVLFVRDGATGNAQETYLKFEVEGMAEPIAGAVLTLHSKTVRGDCTVKVVTDVGWSGSTINWANRPQQLVGVQLDRVTAPDHDDRFMLFDVSEHVTGNGVYSFVVSTSIDEAGLKFASSDNTSTNPVKDPILRIHYPRTPVAQ